MTSGRLGDGALQFCDFLGMEGDIQKRRRGRPPTLKCDRDRVLEAIKGCDGIKGVVASRLGVHRDTLDRKLKSDPSLLKAFEESVLAANETVESCLMRNIRDGNEKAIEFYLERRMPEKYGKRPDAMIGVNVEGSVTIEQMMRKAGESWEIGGKQDE